MGGNIVTDAGIYGLLYADNDAGVIDYYDYAENVQKPLCTAAGCKHDNEACTAWLADNHCFMVFAGGKLNLLYWGYAPPNETAPSYIMQMDPDGTNRRTLTELPAGVNISALCTDDRTLFVSAWWEELGESPDVPGLTDVMSTGFELWGIDLASGEIVLRYDLSNNGSLSYIGVLDDRIVLADNASILDTGYALDAILAFSPSDGSVETLFEGPFDMNTARQFSIYIDGTFYGYVGEQYVDMALQRTDLSTGEKTMLLDPIPADSLNIPPYYNHLDGYLIGHFSDHTTFIDTYVAIDAVTGEWVEYPQVYKALGDVLSPRTVFIEHDGQYVVANGYEEYAYHIEDYGSGDPMRQTGQRWMYALMSKENFWAGSSDMIPVPTDW